MSPGRGGVHERWEGRRSVANAERSAGGNVGTRMAATRVLLWLVVALLAVRQMAVVLRRPGERLIELDTWIGDDGVLHVAGSLYDSGRFTGTLEEFQTERGGLRVRFLRATRTAALRRAPNFRS